MEVWKGRLVLSGGLLTCHIKGLLNYRPTLPSPLSHSPWLMRPQPLLHLLLGFILLHIYLEYICSNCEHMVEFTYNSASLKPQHMMQKPVIHLRFGWGWLALNVTLSNKSWIHILSKLLVFSPLKHQPIDFTDKEPMEISQMSDILEVTNVRMGISECGFRAGFVWGMVFQRAKNRQFQWNMDPLF